MIKADKARTDKLRFDLAASQARDAATEAGNREREYAAKEKAFNDQIAADELKIREAEEDVRRNNQAAAAAEQKRLEAIAATNKAINDAKEEVRKMKAKVAEYLALYEAEKSETTSLVQRNQSA